jgi:hypothetical protein
MKMIPNGFEIINNSDQFRDSRFVNPARSRSHRALVAQTFEESRLISSCLLKILPPILNFCQHISCIMDMDYCTLFPDIFICHTCHRAWITKFEVDSCICKRTVGRESIWMQDYPMEY